MKRDYLIIIVLLLTFFCCKSNKINTENAVSEEPQTDDYAILRETNNISPRIVEDLSGKVILLTEKDFIEHITAIDNPKGFQYLGQTPCVVEIYADWCTPCFYQSQLLNKLAPEYQGKVIFYKLNIDKAYGVRSVFKVENIPVLLFFKPRGNVVTSVGYLNQEKMTQIIEDLLLNS
ncbi:MAG: thioredoxin domain-containing protein [Bacteroidetes bacterium]|nr:thioredoxin domain-containing protein [Bacteroidota bacterium]MCL1969351.1 thioredoxin domain-containing protein [Bacteroidota bacterium]